MSADYWNQWLDVEEDTRVSAGGAVIDEPLRSGEATAEYVHMQLPSGESVRFKRVWFGYRFSDRDVAKLMAGMEIRIDTELTRGIIGSLEWLRFKQQDYFGFSPWSAEAYTRERAPFPVMWNGYRFTDEEEAMLRVGKRVLVTSRSKRSGSLYATHVTFEQCRNKNGDLRWGIEAHFEEFNQPPEHFTRETCPFKPVFANKTLTQAEIAHVRAGGRLLYDGISKAGRPYQCELTLGQDRQRGGRWALLPKFK